MEQQDREMAELPVREMPAMWKCGQEAAALQASTDCPADARQVGGTHYRELGIQPWEAMEAWMSAEAFQGFLRGNCLKYLARCDKKGGLEDLKKARHYLDKLIELREGA